MPRPLSSILNARDPVIRTSLSTNQSLAGASTPQRWVGEGREHEELLAGAPPGLAPPYEAIRGLLMTGLPPLKNGDMSSPQPPPAGKCW